jgi:hypothetical protein
MRFFSKIFKSVSKLTVDTAQGKFELVYSGKDYNIWSNKSGAFMKSVRGTNIEPDAQHLRFLSNLDSQISQLNHKIRESFFDEFNETEEPIIFQEWSERFNLIAVDVESITEEVPQWTITFQDQNPPFAHFNLHIEGQETRGFSIDT